MKKILELNCKNILDQMQVENKNLKTSNLKNNI
jgi:hypothetical protein